MLYDVIDLPKHLSKDDRIMKSIDWACNRLQLPFNIYISFEWDYSNKHISGYCDIDDETHNGYVVSLNPRLNRKETLRTIFHELVHVKQLSDGRLEFSSTGVMRWLEDHIAIQNKVDEPWEIEAYELEKVMYREWTRLTNQKSFRQFKKH